MSPHIFQTIKNPKTMKNQEPNKTSNATITPKHVNQPTAANHNKVTSPIDGKTSQPAGNEKHNVTDPSRKETKGTIETHTPTSRANEPKKTEEKHATVKG